MSTCAQFLIMMSYIFTQVWNALSPFHAVFFKTNSNFPSSVNSSNTSVVALHLPHTLLDSRADIHLTLNIVGQRYMLAASSRMVLSSGKAGTESYFISEPSELRKQWTSHKNLRNERINTWRNLYKFQNFRIENWLQGPWDNLQNNAVKNSAR